MPLTLALIGISVLITLLSSFGSNRHVLLPLYISEYTGGGMREVFQGQVWRLVMPIFMHLGPFHFLFNMLWLFVLGGMLERAQGSVRLGLLVLLTALSGNIAQYFWAGPYFGGMSGVTFGLLGYVWIQGRRNPQAGLVLQVYIVLMMLIWFAVCWSGLIANATNMAHTVGLASGLLAGRFLPPVQPAQSPRG